MTLGKQCGCNNTHKKQKGHPQQVYTCLGWPLRFQFKKQKTEGDAFRLVCIALLELYNVFSLGSTVALNNVELYSLTFVQCFEAVALDCGEVNENVGTAFNFDETKTFF